MLLSPCFSSPCFPPCFLAVNIQNVVDANSYSTGGFNGPMNLFVGDGRSGVSHKYSLDEFMEVSAHEFGHSGLHLWDVYISGHPHPDPNIKTPFPSIMNSPWGLGGAQEVDYAMLFGTKSWQSQNWVYYGSNPEILNSLIGKGNW